MKLLNVLISAAITTLTVFPQISIAKSLQSQKAETDYLTHLDKFIETMPNLTQMDATTATDDKIQYGRRVCQNLNRGMTMNELRDATLETARNSNDSPTNVTVYYTFMQVSAIYHLYPEYKPLLRG